MKKLNSIGLASVFRTSLILGGAAGLLVGCILMLMDFADSRVKEGLATFILAPVLYGLLGSVVNVIMAWLYNRIARRFGGLEIEIEDV